LPLLEPAAGYSSQTLLDVQHALVNLCQARRDLVAVLSLPLHFEKRQCIEWQETLRQRLGLPRQRSAFTGITDFVDLSYLAVYHPWLMVADDAGLDTAQTPTRPTAQALRVTPPDGAICGMIAARERLRQAWVAPANVPLQGVLDLAPAFSVDDWADLFEDQFNLIRREPNDFRAMSAHTLSEERQFLQLSVRRLMILLRKVALERGMAWTFENNDERLRDAVRSTLEALLRFLFERGAFAGRTPQQAFRVVTDVRINTRQSMDQGRFIAQVQVAPSEPLEFITVLLSRASDGVLLALEA
jgi:phage tail sheath protein FI